MNHVSMGAKIVKTFFIVLFVIEMARICKRIKFDEKNTDVRKYGNVYFTMFNL